jgi:hypothetical protein
MTHRTVRTLTVLGASAAAVLLGATTSSAVTTYPWTATHGTATAAGTRWLEKGSGGLGTNLVVQGELKNTGPGCYSLWSATINDFIPVSTRKVATQCGPGTAPVSFSVRYTYTTTSSVYVCKDEVAQDCGPRTSMTTWSSQ